MIDRQKYSLLYPARIVEFFPKDQTATVQICAETLFSTAENLAGHKVRKPIEGVPVHVVGGGGWHMTHPIKTGDTCIISFSQVGYDHWLVEDKDIAGTLAGLPKPHLLRQFSEDDGFVTVGFNTIPRAIAEYSPTDSEWRNADAKQAIRLKEDLSIVIDSTVSLTINAPEVTVNCETAKIKAETSVTLETPDTFVTGNLDVKGLTTTKNIDTTGKITASTDVVGGGISLKGHKHSHGIPFTSPPV